MLVERQLTCNGPSNMSLARWHTGTKAKTLEALRDCKRQSLDIPDLMTQIEFEDDVKDWDLAILECRICGYRHLVVVPFEMDNENNECINCGNMTADVLEEEE